MWEEIDGMLLSLSLVETFRQSALEYMKFTPQEETFRLVGNIIQKTQMRQKLVTVKNSKKKLMLTHFLFQIMLYNLDLNLQRVLVVAVSKLRQDKDFIYATGLQGRVELIIQRQVMTMKHCRIKIWDYFRSKIRNTVKIIPGILYTL